MKLHDYMFHPPTHKIVVIQYKVFVWMPIPIQIFRLDVRLHFWLEAWALRASTQRSGQLGGSEKKIAKRLMPNFILFVGPHSALRPLSYNAVAQRPSRSWSDTAWSCLLHIKPPSVLFLLYTQARFTGPAAFSAARWGRGQPPNLSGPIVNLQHKRYQ